MLFFYYRLDFLYIYDIVMFNMKRLHTMEYCCAHCGNITDLTIEVESSSDYYLLDDECPQCGWSLPDNINDETHKAVINYLLGRDDYLKDD